MGEIQAVYDRSHVINGRLRPAYGHRNVGPGNLYELKIEQDVINVDKVDTNFNTLIMIDGK